MFDEKQIPKPPINSSPPKAVDVLAQIIEHQRKKSDYMPPRPFDAAHWWIDHQEPADEFLDRVERIIGKDGKHAGWKTPYIDRMVSTLRIFLALNEPKKAYVIQQIERGIPWRGDSMEMFLLIVAEEEKMRKDRDGYICQASSVFRGFKQGFASTGDAA